MTMIDFPTPEERRVEAQRLLDGLNGRWVGDRMGVSKATVRLWKRGDRIPDLEDLLRLPEATNRPLDPALQSRMFGTVTPSAPLGKDTPHTASG